MQIVKITQNGSRQHLQFPTWQKLAKHMKKKSIHSLLEGMFPLLTEPGDPFKLLSSLVTDRIYVSSASESNYSLGSSALMLIS